MGKIIITDETGKEREATIIVNFSYESEDYSIYAINRDNDNVNIFVSKLINNDYPLLVDIYNSDKKDSVDKLVRLFFKCLSKEELKEKRIDILENIDFTNSSTLVFTTYKTYAFSIKNSLYERVQKTYNVAIDVDVVLNSKKDDNYNVLNISDSDINFLDDIPQKINESESTLYNLNKSEAEIVEKDLKKISIEKLDINNEDSLKKMFTEKNVETPNDKKGYVSDIFLTLIGVISFAVTLLFLLIQLK